MAKWSIRYFLKMGPKKVESHWSNLVESKLTARMI